MTARADVIADAARRCGFSHAGAAPLGPLDRGPFLAAWLAEGRAGEMGYLATRTAERIDPRLRLPWAQSVLSFTYPYAPPPAPPADWQRTLRGRIAAYALDTDYHDRVRTQLHTLAARLGVAYPGARFHADVDTGPVLEREWGARAGLGWIGRHTLLLRRDGGSYFFLAELFTDLEVEPMPPAANHCGTCTRCVAACPTGALDGAYGMDPRRCLSYLTIEHRSAIPRALRADLGNWIFGCDLCQEACPWNGDARATGDALTPHLPTLLALDADGFRARFGRTAVRRAKRRGLLRNVAVALGNSGNPEAVPALAAALGDPEPLVRSHAAWALGQLGGPTAHHALSAATRHEPDPEVSVELTAALDGS